MSARALIRGAFGCVSILVFLVVLWHALRRYLRVPKTIPLVDPYPQRVEATKTKLELSGKLFDVGMLLVGVLWGLILSDRVPVRLSRWTDIAMFVIGNILVLCSLLFHLLYRQRVATLVWDLAPAAKQPDIFGEHVDYLFQVQWLSFFASLLVGLLTILSARVLGG